MSGDLGAEIREALEQGIREGFDSNEEVVHRALDRFHDEYPLRPEVDEIVRREAAVAFERADAAERAWAIPTDCDRLDRAFAALERDGIVARQNFTCCSTCGNTEIADEVAAAGGPDVVRGYTFFHAQDTESAASGHGLFLAYGAVPRPDLTRDAYESASVAIGHDVVRALVREGLPATWTGDLSRRIEVPLQWRKRRPRP